MRRPLYGPILALALLLECPSPAAAGPPLPQRPPPSKAEHDLQQQAERLVAEGRIADARDVHLTLWRLTQSAYDAFNVGMLSFRLREFVTAAEFLTIYFDRVGTPDAPKIQVPPRHKDKYEAARANFAEARRHIGALEVRVSDPGADVLVDGRQVGVSPLKHPVFVAPGQHEVAAQLGGAKVGDVVAVEAGGERTVRLMFVPAQPAVPPLRPVASGGRGLPPAAPPPRSQPGPTLRWWTVGALAASSAALSVLGGVSAARANDAAGDRTRALHHVRWENAHGCPGASACGEFTAADGRATTWTAISVGAFIGAGLAAGGAGAAAYLLAPEAPVRVGSAPGAGVSVSW